MYVGLVCPDDYTLSSSGTSCIPVQKECTGDEVLNDDETQCIPAPGDVVPFPLFFVSV